MKTLPPEQLVPRPRPLRVAFRTFGCKLNQCETAEMEERLQAAGYRLVEWADSADVRVLNTCTVTAKSDRDCRREIRLAKRTDPECLVVVTGCYAQVDPQTLASLPEVDLVLGNPDKSRLTDLLEQLRTEGKPTVPDPTSSRPALAQPLVVVSDHGLSRRLEAGLFTRFHGYTRAFLKIQNGCDAHCAYCVIPLARGPARSMSAAEVLRQVRLLGEQGFQEVVLTGINLGSWGRDTGEGTVADLLDLLLGECGQPYRFRLSSIEPLDMDSRLLAVIAQAGERVAHHFHLPLQSGSDAVLARMGRPYTADEYLRVVETVASLFPDAALGADVITGFPGESEQEFAETLALLKAAPLTYLHVFSYSDRPGTRASRMRPKVAPEVIRERTNLLRRLGEQKKETFRARCHGTEQVALVLKDQTSEGLWTGLTGNYLEVLLPEGGTLVNRLVRVRLEQPRSDGRWHVSLLSVLSTEPAEPTLSGRGA